MSRRTRSHIPFFRGALGLNMRDDPARLVSDRETGLVEQAEAVNVDILSSRRLSRRPGRLSTPITLAAHSLYSALGATLFVSGGGLYRIDSGPSATLVTSGLSAGARMGYTNTIDQIYFSNGTDKGIYNANDQAVFAWEAGTYYGPRTNRTFSSPPAGHLLEYWQSRIYIADSNVLWFTEPHGYNWVDFSQNGYVFPARITMVRGVSGGLWLSTPYQLYFLAGNTAADLQQVEVASYGAIEGTDVAVDAEDLDPNQFAEGASGRGVVVTTQQGICFCGPGGAFRNLTKQKIYFPRQSAGTAYVYRGKYVAILE